MMQFYTHRTIRRSAFTLIAVALLLHIYMACQRVEPSIADGKYYIAVAQLLSEGKPPVLDLIWQYANAPEMVAHYAFDYWMPMAAFLMAIPMWLFGPTLTAGLAATNIAALALAGITYMQSRRWIAGGMVALGAAVWCYLHQATNVLALLPQSAVFYAVFGSLALWAIVLAAVRQQKAQAILAGIAIGLAYLTRNDGVLLLPALAAAMYFSPGSWQLRLQHFLIALAAFCITIMPYLWMNMHYQGKAFSGAFQQVLWLDDMQELANPAAPPSSEGFFARASAHHIKLRAEALIRNGFTTTQGFTLFALIFAAIGIHARLRKKSRPGQLWVGVHLGYLALHFLVCGLIVPVVAVHGTYGNSLQALLPFLMICATYGMVAALKSYRRALLVIFVLGLSNLTYYVFFGLSSIGAERAIAKEWQETGAALARAGAKKTDVVMSADSFGNRYYLGYPTVAVPTGDVRNIPRMAEKYNAAWLVTGIAAKDAIPGFMQHTRTAKVIVWKRNELRRRANEIKKPEIRKKANGKKH